MTADRLHETLVRTIRNGGDTGRVRAFVAFLVEQFATRPPWELHKTRPRSSR